MKSSGPTPLCGAPVQIELAHLADPEVGALLTKRGHRLASFENVLGLALDRQPDRVSLPGIEVRPSGDDEFEAWIDVVADGFAHPDPQGVPSHEEFPRDVLERAERDFAAAGVLRYIALRDGVVAGGGSLRVADGVAQLAARRPRLDTADGGPERAALGAARGRRKRRLRCRRGHHPAGVEVSTECAASRFRLALYTRRSRATALVSPRHRFPCSSA